MNQPPTNQWKRRDFLCALAATLGSGCSNSTYSLVKASFSHQDTKSYPATSAEIAKIPYASLGIRIGSHPPAVMILAENQDSNLTWVSSDRVILITRGGRLIKCAGMPRDIAGTQLDKTDLIAQPPADWPAGSREILRVVDFRGPDDIGELVRSELKVAGRETIRILDRNFDTWCIEERVVVEKWRWTTLNKFWIGVEDRRVWRSSFRYCPEVPKIQLELLKPAI